MCHRRVGSRGETMVEVTVDCDRLVIVVGGIEFRPTHRTFKLLSQLTKHPGVVHSDEAILLACGAPASIGNTGSIIKRARKELRSVGIPNMIKNIHGLGYYWDDEVPTTRKVRGDVT